MCTQVCCLPKKKKKDGILFEILHCSTCVLADVKCNVIHFDGVTREHPHEISGRFVYFIFVPVSCRALALLLILVCNR